MDRRKVTPVFLIFAIIFWVVNLFFNISDFGEANIELKQPGDFGTEEYDHHSYSTYQELAVDYPDHAIKAEKVYDLAKDLASQYQQFYPNDASFMDEQYTIINGEIDMMVVRSNFENKSIEDEIVIRYWKPNDFYELQLSSDWEVTTETFDSKETQDVEVIAKLAGIEVMTLEKITLDFMEEIPNYYRTLEKTVHIGQGSLYMSYDGEGVYYFRYMKAIEIK